MTSYGRPRAKTNWTRIRDDAYRSPTFYFDVRHLDELVSVNELIRRLHIIAQEYAEAVLFPDEPCIVEIITTNDFSAFSAEINYTHYFIARASGSESDHDS